MGGEPAPVSPPHHHTVGSRRRRPPRAIRGPLRHGDRRLADPGDGCFRRATGRKTRREPGEEVLGASLTLIHLPGVGAPGTRVQCGPGPARPVRGTRASLHAVRTHGVVPGLQPALHGLDRGSLGVPDPRREVADPGAGASVCRAMANRAGLRSGQRVVRSTVTSLQQTAGRAVPGCMMRPFTGRRRRPSCRGLRGPGCGSGRPSGRGSP